MDFVQFINQQADIKAMGAHARTAANYRAAGRAFSRFASANACEGLSISELTPQLLLQFERYLLETCSVCPNTSSFYIRQLRAVYNVAVRDGLCADLAPFRYVYKSIAPTRKRAAAPDELEHLFRLDLSRRPHLAFARDLFCFSFLGHGIPFVDLAHLTPHDIEGSHIVYHRSKTGQLITAEISDAMNAIIRRWHRPSSTYLFPILPPHPTQRDYETALRTYNRRLCQLARIYRIGQCLTSYTARHSWASEAYRLGVPVQTISACMGHSTEATTRIYLKELSTQHLDRSARLVLDAYG